MSLEEFMDWLLNRTHPEAPPAVREAREKIKDARKHLEPARDQWREVRGALDVMAATARGGGQIKEDDR